jgi:hypothetical protein
MLIAGVVLLLFSWGWPRWVGGRRGWTEQDARQYTEAVLEAHRRAYHPGRRDAAVGGAEDEGRRERIEENYRRSRLALDTARARGVRTAVVCRWLGLVGILVGGVMYLASRHEA